MCPRGALHEALPRQTPVHKERDFWFTVIVFNAHTSSHESLPEHGEAVTCLDGFPVKDLASEFGVFVFVLLHDVVHDHNCRAENEESAG